MILVARLPGALAVAVIESILVRCHDGLGVTEGANRTPNDALYRELALRKLAAAGITSLKCIGDCEAQGPIAWTAYANRRYAEELDEPPHGDTLPFRREITTLAQ